MFNFRSQACAWLRSLTINCQRNSMTYASVHRRLAVCISAPTPTDV
jgi:hypothetical protein